MIVHPLKEHVTLKSHAFALARAHEDADQSIGDYQQRCESSRRRQRHRAAQGLGGTRHESNEPGTNAVQYYVVRCRVRRRKGTLCNAACWSQRCTCSSVV